MARGHSTHGVRDAFDVFRRVAAAAADDIQPAALGEVAHERAHILWQKGKAGGRKGIRQSGIRVATEVAGREAGKLLHIGTHFERPKRAVDADAERLGVGHREPERAEILRVERDSALENRDGNLDRHAPADFIEGFLQGEKRGLGIERIENGFDEQRIDAALQQTKCLLLVGGNQFLVGDVARAGIVRIARDGGGAGGRSHRPGDEALAPGILGHEFVAHPAGQFRGFDVELGDDVFQVVVRHGNGLRAEGIGLDDIGPRLEKFAVHRGDDIGTREDKKIAVTLEVLGMILEPLAPEIGLRQLELLERGAHRAINDDNAFLQESFERMHGVGRGQS